jgi:DNA-binding NarL/FixJ family response regulator
VASISSHPYKRQVLLVDDHAQVRNCLRSIVEDASDLEVIAEAADGEQAIAMTAEHRPDLVVMDVNMPGVNGVVATRRIKHRWPNVVVIGLSAQCTPQVCDAFLQAGAVTVLRKEDAGDLLCPVIKFFLP